MGLVAAQKRHDSGRDSNVTVQLLTFFTASFVLAWAAWIPVIEWPSLPSQISFIGLFAPALAGLATAAFYGGRRSVGEVLRRLLVVSFPLRWAVFAVLVMPAVYAGAVMALRVMGLSRTGVLLASNSPLFIVAAFLWLLFVNAGEEIGWRGYALPRLLATSRHPVPASLLLGVIWGIWHLPLYLLPGQSAFPLPLFLVFTTLQSVLYTLLFLRTKGSLLPACLLHAGTDIAPRVFQLTRVPVAFWLIVDLFLGLLVSAAALSMREHIRSARLEGEAAAGERPSA